MTDAEPFDSRKDNLLSVIERRAQEMASHPSVIAQWEDVDRRLQEKLSALKQRLEEPRGNSEYS